MYLAILFIILKTPLIDKSEVPKSDISIIISLLVDSTGILSAHPKY